LENKEIFRDDLKNKSLTKDFFPLLSWTGASTIVSIGGATFGYPD